MKIEIGKRYVTRDGRVTGKVEANGPLLAEVFPYVCTVDDNDVQSCFTKEGRYWSNGQVCDYDLVDEYLPAPPLKRWIQLAVAILALMSIGAVINSFVYEADRAAWYQKEQERLNAEWEKVNAAHESVDSLLTEARRIYQQLKEEAGDE